MFSLSFWSFFEYIKSSQSCCFSGKTKKFSKKIKKKSLFLPQKHQFREYKTYIFKFSTDKLII